jgi:VWFA-related protein
MRSRIQLFIILCFALAFPAFAQQNATPPQHSASRSVVLDVVVTDKSGNPVSGLQQEDFSVLDDKTAARITAFQATGEAASAADSPRQVIFVIDAVNSSPENVSLEQQELRKILLQDGGRLPVPTSLVLLTGTEGQTQPQPTLDGNELANTLNSSAALYVLHHAHGLYAASDQLHISMHALQEITRYAATQPGRKFLIWLSPGWPLLAGSGMDLTLTQKETLFHTVVGISQQLREVRLTLYAVDPLGMSDAGTLRTSYYKSFLKAVTNAKKVAVGNVALQVLAVQSGGLVLNSSNDLQKMIAAPLADTKAYYTLSFDAARADSPDEYHALQLKVDKPGLTARTRTGYYAEPYPAAAR